MDMYSDRNRVALSRGASPNGVDEYRALMSSWTVEYLRICGEDRTSVEARYLELIHFVIAIGVWSGPSGVVIVWENGQGRWPSLSTAMTRDEVIERRIQYPGPVRRYGDRELSTSSALHYEGKHRTDRRAIRHINIEIEDAAANHVIAFDCWLRLNDAVFYIFIVLRLLMKGFDRIADARFVGVRRGCTFATGQRGASASILV